MNRKKGTYISVSHRLNYVKKGYLLVVNSPQATVEPLEEVFNLGRVIADHIRLREFINPIVNRTVYCIACLAGGQGFHSKDCYKTLQGC